MASSITAITAPWAMVLAGGAGTRMRALIRDWLGDDRPMLLGAVSDGPAGDYGWILPWGTPERVMSTLKWSGKCPALATAAVVDRCHGLARGRSRTQPWVAP